MILAVLDTNILVSSLIARLGNEAHLLRAIRKGLVIPCVTEAVFTEYYEVLTRSKFGFSPIDISDTLALFHHIGKLPPAGKARFASPDPNDTKFLQCAFDHGAAFLVTGNRRHFPDSTYGLTRVVSAGELLKQLAIDPDSIL